MTEEQHKANGKKILIIDDDKFLLDMYAIKFKERGFEVYTVLMVQEALSLLESKGFEPDIILVDLVMPGIDGFGFIKEAKEKGLLTGARRAIVLSNLGEPQDVEKAKSLGAAGYIIKANNTPSEVVSQVVDLLKK